MKGGAHVGKIRTVYDVAHARPWGWRVGAYLWTKAIAAGALVVAALLLTLGLAAGPLLAVGAPVLALVFLLATGVLLIADLKRPDRFYFLFTKPNWTVVAGVGRLDHFDLRGARDVVAAARHGAAAAGAGADRLGGGARGAGHGGL